MSFQKLAGIAGLVFAALLIVNTVASGAPPAADDGIGDIVDYFSDYEGGIKLAAAAAALAGVPAVIWAAAVFGRRRALGGESASWALVGLLGFIASGAGIAVVTAVQSILVINVDVLADSPAFTEW